MAMMKSILENVIKSGKFDLARATQLIESGYIDGSYTEDERMELLALRDQHLKPESQAPEMLEVLKRLEEKYAALEARVAELEKGEKTEPGEPEEETIPAWEPWNGIDNRYQHGAKVMHNGFVWESRFAGQNTWEPGTLGTEMLWVKVG